MDDSTLQRQFEALLEPILSAAYGMAMHLARNRDDAEDVLQDACLQAFRGFPRFQQGTNFKAWFFQILANAFRMRYRKAKREPQQSSLDDAPDLYLYCKTAELGLHAQSDDPASLVMGKLDTEMVTAAVERLPEDYRMAATLYFVGDFSYQEIAEILECPVGTVRSRLHRGRKILQKQLWHIAEEHGLLEQLGGAE